MTDTTITYLIIVGAVALFVSNRLPVAEVAAKMLEAIKAKGYEVTQHTVA